MSWSKYAEFLVFAVILDATTGAVLLGFSARLATEHA